MTQQELRTHALNVSGLAMRKVIHLVDLAAQVVRNSANAEIGVRIGDRHGDLPIRRKLPRPQGGADTGITPADDKEARHTRSLLSVSPHADWLRIEV